MIENKMIEIIEKLLNNPLKKLKLEEYIGKYIVEESVENKDSYITWKIYCGIQGIDIWRGNVEVKIDIEKFRTEYCAAFMDLFVPSRIGRQGVGETLMLQMIKTIRVFKEYYSINDAIEVSGWLSVADKQNGNWNKSIPLYEKIGRLDDVYCYFSIGNEEQHYTAEEFLENANSDGKVHYRI